MMARSGKGLFEFIVSIKHDGIFLQGLSTYIDFAVNKENNTIVVTRELAADLQLV